MSATDSIHVSIFAVVARIKGGKNENVMQSFQNYMDSQSRMKCDQEPSTLDVANALIKRCQSTGLIVTATPKKARKGALGVENEQI